MARQSGLSTAASALVLLVQDCHSARTKLYYFDTQDTLVKARIKDDGVLVTVA